MQTIKYITIYQGHRVGETEVVSNNIAHGLIEKGVATLFQINILGKEYKALESPPVDKIMRTEEVKIRKRKTQKYQIKEFF